jgi:hypothetical protein
MMKTAMSLLGKKSENNPATVPALMAREAAIAEDEGGQNETRDENEVFLTPEHLITCFVVLIA